MRPFARWKKQVLARKDRSNKGSIDKPIRPLLAALNALGGYATTSSCSGRSLLLVEPQSGKKNEVVFLFESHGRITTAQLKHALKKLPSRRSGSASSR